ncbi:MAG: Rdx family protein [Sandaracinaceae bacterium]
MARVEITYCPKCRWLPRAAWLAEEPLFTFERGLSVTLRPGEAGEMRVLLDGQILFDRAVEGRFPEPKELKQAIRDRVEPSRDLGHSDG